MRLYETTFLINPQTDDATIDNHVQSVKDVISSQGGKIVLDNRMGTRRLAYEIDGLTQAYYTNLIFEAPAEALSPLERHFRLGEAYLRNLTVLFEGDLERMIAEARESDAAAVQPQVTTEAEEKAPQPRREEAVETETSEQPEESPEEPKREGEITAEPAAKGELDKEAEEALQPSETEAEHAPGAVETGTENVEERVRQETEEPRVAEKSESAEGADAPKPSAGGEPAEEPPTEAQPAAEPESANEDETRKLGADGESTEKPPETNYDEEEQL